MFWRKKRARKLGTTNTGDMMNLYSKDKIEKFEAIWVSDQDRFSDLEKTLNDEDYIDYHIWVDANFDALYKKYFPNKRVLRGVNPNIIFHGGCLGCLSQRKHGIDRCKGCLYFKFDQSKKDLHIKGEVAATLTAEDLNKLGRLRPPSEND